jgi:LmbE family N-acetylglucosaminyl deacetylase
MMRNILAVGAHPDDVELGCGGAISKHLELGDNVFVLVMTNGEQGKHTPERKECLSSLKLLGIKEENIFFGNLSDGNIKDDCSTVNLIENYILKFEIDRVYTHYPIDRHQDHRNCSRAVSSAARKVQEILLFQGPSTKVPFEPHYYVELSENHLNIKLNALNSYKSQIEKGIVNLDLVESILKVNGMTHNRKYAEAFAINHLLRGENDV